MRVIRKGKSLIFVVSAILSVIGFVGHGLYWAFYDMNRLPKGEFVRQSTSPNGDYTIRLFVTNGGATEDYALRGELVENGGKKIQRNIYWDSGLKDAVIIWIGNKKVDINGKEIELPKGKYDFRRSL